jgi:DNA-binding beta-propeller fold protein YncE
MDSSRALNRPVVARAAPIAVPSVIAATPSIARSLSLTRRIELPSVQGRIDPMDIDSDGKRLFVAALGSDSVEVVDLQAGKRFSRIEHLREPQGLAYPAPAHRLFVANGSSGDVQVFGEGKPTVAASAKNLDDAYWPFRGCVNESACSFSERPSVQTAP